MVFIDPETRQRVVTAKHVGDIQYFADQADSTIINEDIALIGPWSDFTGSNSNVDSKILQLWGGIENELWATDAHIDGNAILNNLTERGNPAGITRVRKRLIYKKLDENGKPC